jgi:transposase
MAEIARKTKRYPSDLTDEEWARLAPLMPKPSRRGRKPSVDLREMLNAIRYMARSAGGWRMLPTDFGPWQTVYWWFRRFVRRLLFRTIHDLALMLDRERAGREASPSGGVLDSQTVKAPFAEIRGFDGGKKIVGRKRHIAVDTDGRLLMVNLTTADISDSAGAQMILEGIQQTLAMAEASVRRWGLRSHQADGQGRVPRFRHRDRQEIRRSSRLCGDPPPLGGRADLRLNDPLAPLGARLRETPRRLRGHDPRRHG